MQAVALSNLDGDGSAAGPDSEEGAELKNVNKPFDTSKEATYKENLK